jgi:hypothetical protein
LTREAGRIAASGQRWKPQGYCGSETASPDGAALSRAIELLPARILRPEFQSKSGAKFGLEFLAEVQEEFRRREYFAGGMLRGLRGASPGTLRDRVQVPC